MGSDRWRSLCEGEVWLWLEKWRDYLEVEKRYSSHTLDAYEGDIFHFLRFHAFHAGEEVSMDLLEGMGKREIRSWLSSLQREGLETTSVARRVSSVKGCMKWLVARGVIVNPVFLSMKAPRVKKVLPRPLGEEDTLKVLSGVSEGGGWLGKRDYALFCMLYGSGLRIGEALGLDREVCVRWEEGDSVVIRGKGGKERMVVILPLVREALRAYVRSCPYGGEGGKDFPLFVGVKGFRLSSRVAQRSMEKVRRFLGLAETATPHALRHAFASHLLSKGADLRSIQALLGHASMTTTQRYTKVDHGHLRSVYEKAHPRMEKKGE